MSMEAGAKAATEVIEFAKKHHLVSRLANLFKKKHCILVLGCTGTGKTKLIQSLTQEDVKTINRMLRTTSSKKHRLGIRRKSFVVIDVPGEHKDKRMQAIKNAAFKGIAGVINVVSYGYHEGRGNESDAIGPSGQASAAFLEACREKEIENLKEWTTILMSGKNPPWLITVVTKADLWWNQREEVLKHYEEESYHQALGDALKMDKGVAVCCSVIHKFFGCAPLAGTFDDDDRREKREKLLGYIIACMEG
jgi:hypothetical protein